MNATTPTALADRRQALDMAHARYQSLLNQQREVYEAWKSLPVAAFGSDEYKARRAHHEQLTRECYSAAQALEGWLHRYNIVAASEARRP